MISPSGAPAGILNLIVNGSIVVVLDARIFTEYSAVLKREKFSFPAGAINEIMGFIQREGVFTSPIPITCTLPDHGDLPFIEVSCHAKIPIVTGNIRHFRGTDVIAMIPAEFLSGTDDVYRE
jgi:predicted nucleic acid-binding protein